MQEVYLQGCDIPGETIPGSINPANHCLESISPGVLYLLGYYFRGAALRISLMIISKQYRESLGYLAAPGGAGVLLTENVKNINNIENTFNIKTTTTSTTTATTKTL